MKKISNLSEVSFLFENWEETIIWSCLQGVMGEIWVDNLKQPQSALALLGRFGAFGFLAGQPNIELLETCCGKDIIFVPQHQGWSDLIETTYGLKAHAFTRYATKKDTRFERKKLEQFVASLPADVEIKCIDEELYETCLTEEWSQDLVANYDDYQHYAQLGIGVVALYQGQIVAGASSYSTYKKGIEIEIDTRLDFRRKGLAKALAAQLILTCLDRGLYPSWDAHNKASLALAQQLGYTFSHEYQAYKIDWK